MDLINDRHAPNISYYCEGGVRNMANLGQIVGEPLVSQLSAKLPNQVIFQGVGLVYAVPYCSANTMRF